MAKKRSAQRRRPTGARASARAAARAAAVRSPGSSPAPVTTVLEPPARSNNQARRPPPARRQPSSPIAWTWLSGPWHTVGIPPLAGLLGGASWVLVLSLWAAGAVAGSFAVFLGAVLTAAIAGGWLVTAIAREKGAGDDEAQGKWAQRERPAQRKEPLRAARAGVVLALAIFVPIVFDPHTADVFNIPKYTLVVVGALVLIGLWVVGAVHRRRLPEWRNGLQWLVAAIVVWTAVSALTGIDTHVGLLGYYGSYDGLYAAIAFAVVMMVAAEAVDVGDLRKVAGALAFAGGAVVVLYGLVQLHDSELSGSRWDFINWHSTSFAHEIFSTFGNPNHLAGYLAMIFPIVVVVGLGARRMWWRALAAILGAAVLVEVLRTAARGAWVAMIAAAVVLAIGLAPELRRRPGIAATGAGAVLVAAGVGMAAFGHRLLNEPLSQLFKSGGTTPVEQRFQIWAAAVHIAVNHPATGIGPDSLVLAYPRYESAAWVAGLGPNYLVDGAHDIFMNVLADQGFVGLALFVALLGAITLRSIGAWRRFRATEREEAEGAAGSGLAREHRLVLVALGAGITAYVVQAVFNIQQIGLTFTFWLLVGLLAVACSAAGVPDTLRPGRLLSTGSPETTMAAGEAGFEANDLSPAGRSPAGRSPARRRRGRRRVGAISWVTAIVATATTVVVVLVAVGADGPYRADHAYWAADMELSAATAAARTGASNAAQLSAAYLADMAHAIVLNPWEPRYPATEASILTSTAAHTSNPATLRSDLVQAQALYVKAVADQPLAGQNAESEAIVGIDLARSDKAGAPTHLAAAASAARQALVDNPRDAAYRQLLAQVVADQRTGATKT